MSNVNINIAAEFVGKKAFKQAETSVDKLNKNVKSLGRTLGAGLGTAAIVNYAKRSVAAFAEDEKAATSLGQTLKNLNLAYGSNIGTVNGFINRLEAQTGVLDDELRPAMDRLLRATGNVAESQKLLNLALDVAAGTGKSVTQVSQSLQKAYLGQTQALGRLGVGLSKAELTSSSFEEIQARLTVLFAGQASAAAQTYAGELAKLTVAANNAKETIGKGLVDAIATASGSQGFSGAVEGIDNVATSIASATKNIGYLIGQLEKLKPVLIGLGVVLAATFFPITTAIVGAVAALASLGNVLKKREFAQGKIPGGMGNISMSVAGQVSTVKATLDNTTAVKKLTAAQVAQTKLDKAKAMFDLKKISLAAALGNPNISGDTGNRLRALQAIENGDTANAIKYGNVVKPNASMASPNATVVNVYPQGNVLTEQDLITSIQNGIERNFYRQFGVGAFDK